MNPTTLNTTALRQALKLSERKDTLLQELSKIEKEIESCLKGQVPLPSAPKKNVAVPKKVKEKKIQKRGNIKANILAALSEAGSTGVKISELADQLDLKRGSLYTWFSNFGKKMSEIERVSPGHFRLKGKQKASVEEQKAEVPVEQTTESPSIDLKSDFTSPNEHITLY